MCKGLGEVTQRSGSPVPGNLGTEPSKSGNAVLSRLTRGEGLTASLRRVRSGNEDPVRETNSPALGASGKNSSLNGRTRARSLDEPKTRLACTGRGRGAMTATQARRRHRELGVAEREFALFRRKILLALLVALAIAALVRASGASTHRISIAINATNIAITVGVAADIPTV